MVTDSFDFFPDFHIKFVIAHENRADNILNLSFFLLNILDSRKCVFSSDIPPFNKDKFIYPIISISN